MVMAASAFKCQPQHRRSKRIDAIRDVLGAPFQFDAASLVSHAMQTIERRGKNLFASCIGQHVTGNLPFQELVVRQILIDGVYDPVTIRPVRRQLIRLVPVRIGVTCCVQPRNRHVLPKRIRSQQPVDYFFIGIHSLVSLKCLNLLDRWRQSG